MSHIIKRGGHPESELDHSLYLLNNDAEEVWGWVSVAGQERVRDRVDWIIRTCDLKPGMRVLECGCGTGIFTRRIADTGALITAVDISTDLLKKAQSLCVHKNVTFVRTNLENPLEIPNSYFDAVYGVSILHHVLLPEALQNIRTKLKTGAQFCFSEPNILNPINRYFNFVKDPEIRRSRGISPTEMAFHPLELNNFFNHSGFRVDNLRHKDFLHPRVPKNLIPIVKRIQFVAEHMPLIQRWSGSIWISGSAIGPP